MSRSAGLEIGDLTPALAKASAAGGALVLSVLFLLTGAAKADPGLDALRGKSIILHWTSTWTQQNVLAGGDLGPVYTGSVHNVANVYVGLQGHIFAASQSRDARSASRMFYSDPNSRTGAIVWRFLNGALVGDSAMKRGGRRIEATFSDSFRQCTVRVIYGKLGGTQIIAKSFDGTEDHLASRVSVSDTTCGIRDGNIFDKSQ